MIMVLLQSASAGKQIEVFLQDEYLANGKQEFDRHGSQWFPEAGLGIWPDRPPPRLWKTTDLFRMARGEKIPLKYSLYHISAANGAPMQAVEKMTGTGMVVAVVHSGSTKELLNYYKATYLPSIEEPNLRISRFFAPLLDRKSLENRKIEEISRWLGNASLYLRESPEDRGVIIIADHDLGPLLKQTGARAEGEGKWQIP
jgi:hypothetical protein